MKDSITYLRPGLRCIAKRNDNDSWEVYLSISDATDSEVQEILSLIEGRTFIPKNKPKYKTWRGDK